MVVYFMRRGDKLLICDKELSIDQYNKEIIVGRPIFRLEAKGQLSAEGDDIEKMMGPMQEDKSYKMVLKYWPIE